MRKRVYIIYSLKEGSFQEDNGSLTYLKPKFIAGKMKKASKRAKNSSVFSKNFLSYFLAAVFFLAAAYRLLFISAAYSEMQTLHLPAYFAFFVIALELLLAVGFLSKKFVSISSVGAIVFIASAVLAGMLANFQSILSNLGELFIFNPTPTDILLHLMYVLVCVILLRKQTSN